MSFDLDAFVRAMTSFGTSMETFAEGMARFNAAAALSVDQLVATLQEKTVARRQRPDLPHYPDLTAPGTDEYHDELFGLYRAVLAAPHDDLPRLVFADRLEEVGRDDDAKYIRLAVDYDRGSFCNFCFSSGVVANDNVVDGVQSEACPFCFRGEGGVWFKEAQWERKLRWFWPEYLDRYLHAGGRTTDWVWRRGFPARIVVNKVGFVRGTVAGDLVTVAPIEEIRFRHAVPREFRHHTRVGRSATRFRWFSVNPDTRIYDVAEIPSALFKRFDRRRVGMRTVDVEHDGTRFDYRHFESEAAAFDALSEVAVDFARERADLAPLPFPATRVKRDG